MEILADDHSQDKVYTTTIDDNSSAFQYSGTGWTGDDTFGLGYYNNSGHLTANVSDSVALSRVLFFNHVVANDSRFNGSSVQVFGGTNSNHGNYSVV